MPSDSEDTKLQTRSQKIAAYPEAKRKVNAALKLDAQAENGMRGLIENDEKEDYHDWYNAEKHKSQQAEDIKRQLKAIKLKEKADIKIQEAMKYVDAGVLDFEDEYKDQLRKNKRARLRSSEPTRSLPQGMLREVDLGTLFQKAPTKKTSYLREVDIQPMFASVSLLREIPVASMFHEGDDTAEIAEMLTKSLSKPEEQVASWNEMSSSSSEESSESESDSEEEHLALTKRWFGNDDAASDASELSNLSDVDTAIREEKQLLSLLRELAY